MAGRIYERFLIASFPVLGIVNLLSFRCTDKCIVIFLGSFDLLFFLMTYDIKHLFIWLLAIVASSLMKCLFRYFAYYYFSIVILILLNFKSFLYSQDTISLSDKYFSHSLERLFLFISVFWRLKVVIMLKSMYWFLSSMVFAFSVLRNVCLLQGHKDFLLYFLLEVFQFGVLYLTLRSILS